MSLADYDRTLEEPDPRSRYCEIHDCTYWRGWGCKACTDEWIDRKHQDRQDVT